VLAKNLIRLLLVQDRKDEGSGDLLVRSLVLKRLDWSSYGGSATARIDKNSNSIRYVLAWPVGCLYSPVQPTSYRDHDLSRFRTLNS
jgi:hypothetical protein